MMKPFETLMDHKHYPIRVMIEDAFIILAPSLLLLISLLCVYWKEWSVEWLAQVLASFLPFY